MPTRILPPSSCSARVLMLHADHSYLDHEMSGVTAGVEVRGAGIEIRLYGADPDHAEARASELGHVVLAGSMDKPHGLRECHIVGRTATSSCRAGRFETADFAGNRILTI